MSLWGLDPKPPPPPFSHVVRAAANSGVCMHGCCCSCGFYCRLHTTHEEVRNRGDLCGVRGLGVVGRAGPGEAKDGSPDKGGPGGARLTPKRLRPGSESLGAPHRPRDIKGCAQHACGPIHGGRAHSHWRGHGNARPKHAGHHRHSGSPRPECTGNGHGGEEASRRVHSGASGVHDTSSPPICMSGRNSPGGGPGVLEVPLAVEVG